MVMLVDLTVNSGVNPERLDICIKTKFPGRPVYPRRSNNPRSGLPTLAQESVFSRGSLRNALFGSLPIGEFSLPLLNQAFSHIEQFFLPLGYGHSVLSPTKIIPQLLR